MTTTMTTIAEKGIPICVVGFACKACICRELYINFRGGCASSHACAGACRDALADSSLRSGGLPGWGGIYLKLQTIDPAHDDTFSRRHVDRGNRIPEFAMNEDFTLRS